MTYTIKKEKLSTHLWRLIDTSLTACYLVIGENKAALLDTGIGVGNLKKEIQAITQKPLIVILTHGHLDHIGGANAFENSKIYLNQSDDPMISTNVSTDKRATYTKEVAPEIQYSDMLPAWNGKHLPIADGQVFDLGNIHIKMISVPGHTQGMMCPLIIEERTIIFGDACGVAVMLFDQYSSTVSQYLISLQKLQKYETQYDIVYRNHGTFTNKKELLENVMTCCTNVLLKTDDHVPYKIHDKKGWMAKQIDPITHQNADGNEGNLFYTLEKAR